MESHRNAPHAMITTKAASNRKLRRKTMVAVITMEEISVLAEAERAAFLASLKETEAHIKEGTLRLRRVGIQGSASRDLPSRGAETFVFERRYRGCKGV